MNQHYFVTNTWVEGSRVKKIYTIKFQFLIVILISKIKKNGKRLFFDSLENKHVLKYKTEFSTSYFVVREKDKNNLVYYCITILKSRHIQ